MKRLILAAAVLVALVGGSYAAQRLLSGNAATIHCGLSRWRGVTGAIVPSSHPVAEARVVRLVNEYRVAHGLHALRVDDRLAYEARYHSLDEQRRGYFAHERAGETYEQRFARYTPSTCIAENIAYGTGAFGRAPGIVSLWRSSPPHRHVMLLPWVTRIGVGITGTTRVYSTAAFSG